MNVYGQFWITFMFFIFLTLGIYSQEHPQKTTGAQYLIISFDDSAIIEKLQELANFRQDQGISTIIVTTSELGGSSVASIGNFIKDAYYTWDIPPIAVMLVGDDDKIPSPPYPGGSSKGDISDNFYADINGDDLPDMAVSRLPINDVVFLNTYINRVIDFETSPPDNPDYYLKPLTSMAWSSNSNNMICAEAANGFFSNKLDKEPIRQNAIFAGTPGNDWECSDELYLTLGPDGEGYVPASPEYLTNWNGNATGINSALSSGTFLILNLDHGTEYGWSTPEYWSDNLYEVYSADPFFVISINSLNGKFNWSFDVFAESLIKYLYGSLGVIAPTMSLDPGIPAYYFTYLMDALWEEFLPANNQNAYPIDFTLPAFANVSAKYAISNMDNSLKTIYSFEYFGEPFCPITYELPTEMEVTHAETFGLNTGYFEVSAPENSVICLSVNHEIKSVETGTGSVVSMPVEDLFCDDTLTVTVTKQNHLRYYEKVVCDELSSINKSTRQKPSYSIFPNPASEQLFIQADHVTYQTTLVSIYNSHGGLIKQIKVINSEFRTIVFDIKDLPIGLYHITILSESNNFTQKFIKIK